MQPALHPPHEVPAGGGQGWAGHPGQQHQPLPGDSAGQGRDGSAAWDSVRGGRCWQVPAQVRGAFCTKCQRGDVWWAGSKAHFPLPSTIPKEQFLWDWVSPAQWKERECSCWIQIRRFLFFPLISPTAIPTSISVCSFTSVAWQLLLPKEVLPCCQGPSACSLLGFSSFLLLHPSLRAVMKLDLSSSAACASPPAPASPATT